MSARPLTAARIAGLASAALLLSFDPVAAVAQSQLEELVSLIPNTKSRSTTSISYATLPSGFTSRDFEQPIAELQAKIDELKNVGSDNAINLDEEIQRLQAKMRQKILNNGAMLVDKKEDSEITIELCSGGVGTDNVSSFIGTPGLTVPGLPVELPEVRLYEKTSQLILEID